jgi:Pyruvate/2-oxoacid:ferredoxin oxidoreductase delta subunit
MSLNQALHLVLYEGMGAQPLRSEARLATMSTLLERGYGVTCTTSDISVDPHGHTVVMVLGQFAPNTAPSLQQPAATVTIRFQEISGLDGSQIAAQVEAFRTETSSPKHGEWKPWFPVIDYDRCTNCMQCLSFCLFGVYGVDADQRIQVQNHDNCKTNCPACSRVCPEAAIMFPKYKAGPINGDIVSDADLQREKMKIDISALLGGDVYQMLRERSERAKSRFSKERDADKALKERQKCLVKLAQSGNIPPEVLMALPSPEEIVRRAAEAKAKAEAALARQ